MDYADDTGGHTLDMAVTPRKASVGIVARKSGELLMARRSMSLRFMGGHHVFPGGAVGQDETTNHVINAPDEETALSVHAAAREVFEESGLLCAEGGPVDGEAKRTAQAELLEGKASFDAILERFGAQVDAARFERAGHWVTPEESPIRFDTSYFMYRLDGHADEHFVEGEIVGLDWMTAGEARSRWHRGLIELSTPVALTLHVLSRVPYPDNLQILRRPRSDFPGDPKRMEIRRGVSVIPLDSRTIPPATQTNCIFVGEEELYVIDPGAHGEEEMAYLKRHLDFFEELGASVKAVLLTHSHRDHVEAAAFVRDGFDAPIWAHEAVAKAVDFSVDRCLADGDVLTSVGSPEWRLRAVHTPGHDPGHLSFYEESTKSLICGDMMANPGTIVVSPQHGGDMGQFIESLERLMTMETHTLVPAHGMPMTDAHAKIKEHLDHRLWREDKIKRAVDAGFSSLATLLTEAYDDVPKEVHPLAEQSLKAHLAKLGVTLEG